MNKIFKQYLPDVIIIAVFAVMSLFYFSAAVSENKVLLRGDASAGKGMGHDISEYKTETGEMSRWTEGTFSGMPTYQIAPSYDSSKPLDVVAKAYHLALPEYVWYLFAYLLGFYILLRAFDFKWHLAALGSVLWAFSSYFLIIIAAGHIWKVMALAYLPPMIGGIILTYKGRYLWGFVVTALFTALEINANHVQMTYYYLFIILFMVLALLADAIKKGEAMRWVKATGVVAAAGLIGIMMNISNLYHTWEYQKESMRGKSELVKGDAKKQTSSGLDRDYITGWSYGGDEMLTLMIPNANGGTSEVGLAEHPDFDKYTQDLDEQQIQVLYRLPQYWGSQPGTSGPVYVGAFVILLFILGIFIVKGPMKWALLCATILSMLLSLGHNFQWFTDLFIDYVPMYAKFRTVSSILVIAEFTMPLLAILALKRLHDEPELMGFGVKDITAKQKRARIYLLISLVLTAGVCLFIALFPDVMPHLVGVNEAASLKKAGLYQQLAPAITSIRESILVADCWRSFWIIITGTAFVVAYQYRKINHWIMVGGIAAICLFDLWQVDKRYLNDGMFNADASQRDIVPEMSYADEQILKDKDTSYRVVNLTNFSSNKTSYYHKSIGGYHAAKLRRYQEFLDAGLMAECDSTNALANNALDMLFENIQSMDDLYAAAGEMSNLLVNYPIVQHKYMNMLNVKYGIIEMRLDANTEFAMHIKNPFAYGVAWYVDDISYADNANKELDGMKALNLRHQAIADKSFTKLGKSVAQDSLSNVEMTKCTPNHLEYTAQSNQGGVIVFSEIYYPGWTATVDGKPAEISRVNYILRALNVTPGKHTIIFDYHPESVDTTETIAYIATFILLLAALAAIALSLKSVKRKD